MASYSFAQSADLVVLNAHVYTVDAQRPETDALAVRDGKIVAIGGEATKLVDPGTRKIDAKGRTIVPGFIDSHGHMSALGDSLETLDLRGLAVDAIAAKVKDAAAQRKPGEWITGRGWDQNLWVKKEFPTAAMLDSAAPDNPVWLARVDGHAGWANSEALATADVNAATKDPDGGVIVRDAAGKPTGVFIDRAKALVVAKIPAATQEQIEARLRRAAEQCARLGLTTVHDAGIDAPTLDAYRALIARGQLPVRVYAMIAVPSANALWETYQKRGPEISDTLTVRSVKLVADGALGSRGAAMIEPYTDAPGNKGLLILDKDFIARVSKEAARTGFQVNTHAIGDLANRTALDAYATVLQAGNDKRFRIEHAQIIAPEDFVRFKELSVIASMQPTHATSDMPWAATRVGPKRIEGAYAWHKLISLGVHVPSGSDFPVEDANPIWGFYSAITRQDHEGRPAGGWFPQQRMTRAQALRSWTIEGAYAAFEEDRKGTLMPGKLADFVMLSDDIMQVAPERVWRAHVVMTVLGGKVVYAE